MSETAGSVLAPDAPCTDWTEALPASIKPNLFIIGSMKSGTTLLWRVLASHPAIHMSTPKEPCYFVEPSQLRRLQPWLWRERYWLRRDRYFKLFHSNESKIYAGEASVYYTHLPLATGVAERIWRFNPNARLIYIMRDPIERTISHYWHSVISNSEFRSPLRAIREDTNIATSATMQCNWPRISPYSIAIR
jgi:hypothetical protein